MAVDFTKCRKGHTLLAGQRPHYRKGNVKAPKVRLFKPGEPLMVTKEYPAGVRVQNSAAVSAEYFFDDGADKLEYTPETQLAIDKEDAFLAQEARDSRKTPPTMDQVMRSMETLFDDLQSTKAQLKTATDTLASMKAAPPVLPQGQQQQQRVDQTPGPGIGPTVATADAPVPPANGNGKTNGNGKGK